MMTQNSDTIDIPRIIYTAKVRRLCANVNFTYYVLKGPNNSVRAYVNGCEAKSDVAYF